MRTAYFSTPSSNDNITAYMRTYILGKQSRVSEKSVSQIQQYSIVRKSI